MLDATITMNLETGDVGLKSRVNAMRSWAAGAGLLFLLVPLTGCPFFVCAKASCTDNTTVTAGTGDYAYVSNSTSGATYIDGYTVSSTALTEITGGPFQMNYVPVAMKVSPNNLFLYVAAAPGTNDSGLWVYLLNEAGAPTEGTEIVPGVSIYAMDISNDGNFLFLIDQSPTTGATQLAEYVLNSTAGTITSGPTTYLMTSSICTLVGTPLSQGCTVRVAPSLDYVAVALGATGTELFPYTSAAGITSTAYTALIGPPSSSGDFSLAFDDSDFLYIASTNNLISYGTIATSPLAITTETYSGGTIPRSVTVSSSYSYAYTANEGASTISGYSLAAGVLAPLSGGVIAGPTNVSALGVDNTGDYLLAAGYNSTSGVELFSIGTTGLSEVAHAATGTTTTIPVVVAMTY